MKLVYKCRECGHPFVTEKALSEHLRSSHQLQIKEYYDKYVAGATDGKCEVCGGPTTFISMSKGYKKKCENCRMANTNKANDPNNETCTKECKICGFSIAGSTKQIMMRRFFYHLNTHNISVKDYYDRYEKKPGDGICPMCGKPTNFISISEGYRKYCGPACVSIAANQEKARLDKVEKEFQEEQREIVKTREEAMKDYIQALKAEAHKYDWEGERNSWMGGPKNQSYGSGNNLLTDNSVSFIDGQSFDRVDNGIDESDNQSFNDVFWL